jgi:hypothetical protein
MATSVNNPPRKDQDSSEPTGMVDSVIPWLLIAFAIIAVIGAVIRTVSATDLTHRLDSTTLLYLVVGGVLLLLRQVKTFSFGGYKLEMLERFQERQAKQEDQIELIRTILPLLLPKAEQKHLRNLKDGKTSGYKGNHDVRTELRRLRSMNLIRRKGEKHIREIENGATVDLVDFVELTPLGERWVNHIKDIESSEAG